MRRGGPRRFLGPYRRTHCPKTKVRLTASVARVSQAGCNHSPIVQSYKFADTNFFCSSRPDREREDFSAVGTRWQIARGLRSMTMSPEWCGVPRGCKYLACASSRFDCSTMTGGGCPARAIGG